MNRTKIQVPGGIRYLSQWTDFGKQLPDCHFILNKALTGVGATEYFLKNNEKVILCSPRCSLIENKRPKHPDAWIYRDISDNASSDGDGKTSKPKKKATFDDIKKFNEEVVEYIGVCKQNSKTPKIMTTYDSLGHIVDALRTISPTEPGNWTLVIDEFQVIFGDSNFKSLTEMIFLENAKFFTKAIFLSATPYLMEYLEQMDEFKDLPYLELEWPKEMEEKAIVTNITIKKGDSRGKICKKIIEKMRIGQTVKFGSKEIDTKEAVFYINNVADIIKITKACNLKSSEVNILCSRSQEDKLTKAGLKMGTFPKEGEPHKMFTFATKSVFLGVDFNSECAMSYVFADPSQKTLALDISTDLPQILGRQRLDRNPYRHEAILFVKENSLGLDDKEFTEYIVQKKKDTETLIREFSSQSPEVQTLHIKKYRTSMERDRYKNDYLMVVDDRKTGKAIVAFNTLYMFAEIRAWEISKKNFRSEYSIIKEQEKSGITGTTGTMSTNPDVLTFKKTFEGTKVTDKRIKEYCEFRLQHPELIEEIDFVSTKYSDYWDALGFEGLKNKGFQESKILATLAEPTPFGKIIDSVILEIRSQLKEKLYEVKEIKEMLNKAYKKAGLNKIAKAKDIEKYLSAKIYQDSKTGKRYYDIQSIYQKNITMFPFVWRPNASMGLTIDRFLDIIQTGKYTIKKSGKDKKDLKEVIADIRKISNHDAQGKLKKDWLPVACVNGSFEYKDDHGLTNYSSFVALDFDGFSDKIEMESTKEHLKTYPWVYAIFETPSGLGLKAIVLHDSTNPTLHWNLMKQLMEACSIPETDTSVVDLSRGQFFSYDPNLWKNPNPIAYHFVYDPKLEVPIKPKEKFISASGSTTSLNDTKLDSWTENFLHHLWQCILTDDAVIERLDKHWKESKQEYFEVGNRHRSMLIIAGTLCKAGILPNKATDYLTENYPEKDILEIGGVIQYAYDNNAFGCDRRRYR